jgi:hypothetical protein
MSDGKILRISEIDWKANNLWPTCSHGYYITPSHKCPWCADVDISNFKEVVGRGNGWLMNKDDKPCDDCGGPAHAGYGAFDGTKEEWEAEKKIIELCYKCAMAKRFNK